MNNMNQEKNIEIINPREIIIATNLAGRGTDIKTDEIEKYGGLHVIVTFMPSNKQKITQLRDKIEANMLSDFEKHELK
ncbi:unnamed protein product, partial [Rotaria sp. Silwood2]